MKVLFAPIGDPSNYKVVEYQVNGKKTKNKASFFAIKEILGIEHVVIIAGLSLSRQRRQQTINQCFQDVASHVKKSLNLKRGEVTVLVAPNVYGNQFIQTNRENTIYYNYIYLNTLKILNKTKPSEVHIDITHGINYMPLLATDAIKLATNVHVIQANIRRTEPATIKLEIHNSEPIIPNNAGPYNINSVYKEEVNLRKALIQVLTPFLSKEIRNLIKNNILKTEKQIPRSSEQDEGGVKGTGCDADLISAAANALFSGVFPYLVSSRGELEECMKTIRGKMEILDQNKLKKDPNKLFKYTNNKLIYQYTEPIELSYVHSLLTVTGRIARSVKLHRKAHKSYVKISDIEKLAKNYSVADTISSLVADEIDKLSKNTNINANPQLLAKILGDQSYKPTKMCMCNKRNLLAHGGFEQNVTYIWKKGKEILMSYGECIENVRNNLT